MKNPTLLLIMLATIYLISCKKDPDPNPDISPVTSVQLMSSSITLVVGAREKLLLIVEPAGATVSNASWSSSSTAVASITEKGTVSAIAVGETIIDLHIAGKLIGQCAIKVITWPIANLKMPDVEFPIAKDALVFIMGNGFKSGDKIWLRKLDGSGETLKSTNNDGDILAQIINQTENYISFLCSIAPGWYSLVLEQNNNKFYMGNMQAEIPNIPEYVYDKNKIFWEDTHWRRFHLRGKVKELTLKEEDFVGNSYFLSNNVYIFSQNGLIEEAISYGNFDPIFGPSQENYYYDNKNRIIKIIDKYNDNITGTCELTYGDHEFYLDAVGIRGIFGTGVSRESTALWFKGLTQFKYYDRKNGTLKIHHTKQITPGSNSLITIDTIFNNNGRNSVTNSTYTYNGNFPIKLIEKIYYSGIYSFEYVSNYEFSTNGMPISLTRYGTYGEEDYYSYQKFMQNCPFELLSELGETIFEYDKNWNFTKQTWEGNQFNSCYYFSYDEYGNWTQCIDFTTHNSNSFGITTRNFTYW